MPVYEGTKFRVEKQHAFSKMTSKPWATANARDYDFIAPLYSTYIKLFIRRLTESTIPTSARDTILDHLSIALNLAAGSRTINLVPHVCYM